MATGAADFSNGDGLPRLRFEGAASPAGAGSVACACREETAVRAEEAPPSAFELSLEGSVEAMGRLPGLSWRLVDAKVRSDT